MIWDVAYFADLPLQRLQERSQGALNAVRNEVVFINDIFEVESWLILRRALNTIHESPWLKKYPEFLLSSTKEEECKTERFFFWIAGWNAAHLWQMPMDEAEKE